MLDGLNVKGLDLTQISQNWSMLNEKKSYFFLLSLHFWQNESTWVVDFFFSANKHIGNEGTFGITTFSFNNQLDNLTFP